MFKYCVVSYAVILIEYFISLIKSGGDTWICEAAATPFEEGANLSDISRTIRGFRYSLSGPLSGTFFCASSDENSNVYDTIMLA